MPVIINDAILSKIREDNEQIIKWFIGSAKNKTLCPFHRDQKPSMQIMEWGFKCHGCGATGDAISFVRQLYGLDFAEAVRKIVGDVGYDVQAKPSSSAKPKRKTRKRPREIRYRSREWTPSDWDYWAKRGISAQTLREFKVIPVREVWVESDKKGFYLSYDYMPGNPCYLYDLGQGLFKAYCPFSAKQKFLSNCPGDRWQGTIDYSYDHIVIASSRKDAMLLHELGYNTIAPQSENTIPDLEPLAHFDHKLVFFDNGVDEIDCAQALAEKIGCPYTYIPVELEAKDPTDFHRYYGYEETAILLYELIEIHFYVNQS